MPGSEKKAEKLSAGKRGGGDKIKAFLDTNTGQVDQTGTNHC